MVGWLGQRMCCSPRTRSSLDDPADLSSYEQDRLSVDGRSVMFWYTDGENVPYLFATCTISDNTDNDALMNTKLDKLLQKEAQLKAQIQLAKSAERTLEKKRDTRRKVLIGAAVMARVESGRWPQADLLEMMNGFLTRPNERELFELDELAVSAAEVSEPVKQQATTKDEKPFAEKKLGKARLKQAGEPAARKLPESDLDIEKEFNL